MSEMRIKGETERNANVTVGGKTVDVKIKRNGDTLYITDNKGTNLRKYGG